MHRNSINASYRIILIKTPIPNNCFFKTRQFQMTFIDNGEAYTTYIVFCFSIFDFKYLNKNVIYAFFFICFTNKLEFLYKQSK